ncbi:hypothetical protein Agub_g14990 [Astrephomene gubernaculifera]|uniref:Glycosyl transferase 48 domain-containing protein n=1 Tax=Astrephomene gubernaculifera TaxID=47775 RepID=A0AAD3E4P8_9CHLO|nr:hypothetical protein Agub_g14990 [Astrephomene gubernaculifera]
MSVAGGSLDEWEEAVVTYCLSFGLQFGFQVFAARKEASNGGTTYSPSTVFIATHTLTAALQDVASRTTVKAAPDTPADLAGLACAVRDLHGTIFQTYKTWLKAAKLRPAKRPAHSQPNADSLHYELADLALYWLVYSEAANLRHTPEMIWFIYYCAQSSWQAKQVLFHLRLHHGALAALSQQPWLAALGPGLTRAVQALHARYRRTSARGCGYSGQVYDRGNLLPEATLTLPSGVTPAVEVTAVGATSEGSAPSADNQYGKGVGSQFPDRSSSPDPVPGSGSSCNGSSHSDDVHAGRDNGSATDSTTTTTAQAAACLDAGGRRRMSPASPSLPLPPAVSVPTSNIDNSTPKAVAGPPFSAFAIPVAAESLVAAVLAPPPTCFPATPQHLGPVASTPMSPVWDPKQPVRDYPELLLRFCPNEAAVAAALAAGGSSGSEDMGDGGKPDGGSSSNATCGTPFLSRVVQPLFLFLTEQIFELGQARRQGLESAVRISYDDVSESMAHPDVVEAALACLPWATTTASVFVETGAQQQRGSGLHGGAQSQPLAAAAGAGVGVSQHQHQQQQQEQHRQQVMPRAAVSDEELYWSRLLALSDLPSAGAARIPWQGDMAHYRPQLLRLLHGGSDDVAANRPMGRAEGATGINTGGANKEVTLESAAVHSGSSQEAVSELSSLRRANAAADWWARHVLRKTFVEHRSLAMPLIAFARVYQFQLVWFYLLCVWSWASEKNMMHWIASGAALHWGSCCLLWTMQAVLSTGARMKRSGAVIPFYASSLGRPHRGSGPAAPSDSRGLMWWLMQLYLLVVCWTTLGVGLYVAYIVWPHHDFYGFQCYPLFWGRSCYWWIAVVYGGALLLYELLYRQLNLGGYARSHFYDVLLRLMPGGGTSSASSCASPMYDPAAHLRTGPKYLVGNAALWGSALALKFVIDYFIVVRPAGPRLREIMALSKLAWSFHIGWSWWPEGWSRRFKVDVDPCLAAAQVVVLFLLSLVSSGVAYTVASAVCGTLQGVRQGLGSIRNWGHIRAGFHRVQAAMRAKLLSTEDTSAQENRSWVFCVVRAVYRTVLAVLLLPYSWVVKLLRWTKCLPPPVDNRPKSWEQREETLAITAPFWNAVVRSMRGRDLLSDRELAALSFSAVSLSPASLMMATWRRGGSNAAAAAAAAEGRRDGARLPRETYLPPVAVYVAQIPHLIMTGSSGSSEQLEVLQEAYMYLLHLLVAVRAVPRSAAAAEKELRSYYDNGDAAAAAAEAAAVFCPDLHKNNFHPEMFASMRVRAPSHRHLVARRELLGGIVALVRALLEAGKVYKDTAGVLQGGSGGGCSATAAASTAANNRSRAVDKLCMALHAVARGMTKMKDLPWNVTVIGNRVVGKQYYHQPAVKASLDRGFSALVAPNRNNATTWGAEHMPAYEDFAKVTSWLLAILRPSDEGTAPTNSEALALLADFCSGLLHPGLPTAPRVERMRSVTTLIPHYQETVLYALSSSDARRVLEASGATALEGNLADDEVLFKNDEGAPSELLQYLVSEFPDEFRNLLERCRTLVPLAKEDPPYVLDDFLPYGRLYEHRAQLLLWASFRGQVLARTVDGMSMYRTALAMQAVHDAMNAGNNKSSHNSRNSGNCSRQNGSHPPKSFLPSLRPHGENQTTLGRGEGGRGGGCGDDDDNAGGGGGHGDDEAQDGRLVLSGVQRMMVRGILRDPALSVEELVAQLVDVVPGLGPLLERKFGLVVSSQVFARMAGSRSLADRWRAHGIALLATRYPALRVAYLEQDDEPITLFKAPDFTYRVVHQASVLVRAVPLEREAELRRQRRAEREAAAASANATAAFSTGHPYDSPSFAAGGAATATANAVSPSAAGTPSWVEGGCSVCGDDDGSEDGTGDGDEIDVGTVLRLWRRRNQLRHLKAAELEVLFRQRLPVNYYDTNGSGVGVILGEGKPENQNTAVPYCPGVLLQTIDMNQDNSLAQAFKLRNATREFEPLGPRRRKQQVAVLGYPEWIFSYRCGLLADLAAATERTFGTQLQRVMAFPSAVRSHYGHPDLWNRLFSMTRGGVSKSNAVQHVSEDVFGGYNALKRGGLSKYVSYISVGKGRDMGLDSILGFEGKISKGCAEQLMSRDLRFLGAHTDFFRCMSLYFTVPGHFINTWLTVLTIRLGVWVQLLLLLGGVGKTGGSLASAMGAVQILQLGTMPMLGYIFNLWLESGLSAALATVARQFVAGGLLFHIFRSTTSAFHLGRAVLFGGASYVATGRGFSLRRKSFTQVYVNYGRSHLYFGADILLMVVLILVAGNNGGNALPIPAVAMWSPLLVAAALLAGPFWFTPFFFRLNQVLRDTREFRDWLAGSAARGVPEGWAEWNASQLATLRDDSGSQVPKYRFWSTAAIVVPRAAIALLSALVAVTGARFDALGVPDMLWVLGGSVVAWSLLALKAATHRAYLSSGLGQHWRWAKGLVQVLAMSLVTLLAAVCLFMPRKGLRFSGVLIAMYANYQVASLLVCICVAWFPKTMLARSLTNAAYRQADAALGIALAAALIIICFIGEIGLVMVDKVQTLVQFNDRYSHTQAARPYAGDDDPAAAATLIGGGAGLAAAAMAVLRRRLPSQTLALPPLNASTGGIGGGPAAVGGSGMGHGIPLPPMNASVQPSNAMQQGWVSPRCRLGGGSTTPVMMFSNHNANCNACPGLVNAAAAAASDPESPPAIKSIATMATPTSSTASTAVVDPPGYLQSPSHDPQRQLSATSRLTDIPSPSNRGSSLNGDVFTSATAIAAAAAAAAAAATGTGMTGGQQQQPSRTASFKEVSWSSSPMSTPVRQGLSPISVSVSGVGSTPTASASSPLEDGTPCLRSNSLAAMRLPPVESRRPVAVSPAPAEAAIQRNAVTLVPQPPPRPPPSQLQQASSAQQQPSTPQEPSPSQLQPEGPRPQHTDSPQDVSEGAGGRNAPSFAWIPRPPTEPPASSTRNATDGGAAAATADTATSRPPKWANRPGSAAVAFTRNRYVSPVRQQHREMRPLTADPRMALRATSERTLNAGAADPMATTIGGIHPHPPRHSAGGTIDNGSGGGGGGSRARVRMGPAPEASSFAAPRAAALAHGALSGWVDPRAMQFSGVGSGGKTGDTGDGSRPSGGDAV